MTILRPMMTTMAKKKSRSIKRGVVAREYDHRAAVENN
jgi:hypothetical protein